jgi:hypothetical protein
MSAFRQWFFIVLVLSAMLGAVAAPAGALEVLLRDGTFLHLTAPTGVVYDGGQIIKWRIVGLPERIVFTDRQFSMAQRLDLRRMPIDVDDPRAVPAGLDQLYPYQPFEPMHIEWCVVSTVQEEPKNWTRAVTLYRTERLTETADQGFGRSAVSHREERKAIMTLNTASPIVFMTTNALMSVGADGYVSSFNLKGALDRYLLARGLTLRFATTQEIDSLWGWVGRTEPVRRDLIIKAAPVATDVVTGRRPVLRVTLIRAAPRRSARSPAAW